MAGDAFQGQAAASHHADVIDFMADTACMDALMNAVVAVRYQREHCPPADLLPC